MKHLHTRFSLSALSLLTATLIAACGGGGTTTSPTTLSGKVIDGYITGATVCLDVNSNNACDSGEPSATTASGGAYSLVAPAGVNLNTLHLLVNVPVGAVDSVSGAVTQAYKMMAPASMPSVITPLTTAISAEMITNNLAVANARLAARTDLAVPVDYDFAKDHIATQDNAALNVAKVMAATLANKVGASAPSASNLGDALQQIKILASSAYSSSDVSSVVNSLLTPQISFESNDTSGYALGGDKDFGGNTSSLENSPPAGANGKAAKVIKGTGAATWAGTTFLNLSSISKEIVSSVNRSVSIRVYSPKNIPIRLKLEQSSNSSKSVEVELVTKFDGWQNLIFDTQNQANGTAAYVESFNYDKASIFFNCGHSPSADQTYYFDDIYFTPNNAISIISLLSGKYTSVPIETWRASWSGASISESVVNGDPIKSYVGTSNGNYAGVEFKGANAINATNYDYFTFDLYPEVSGNFKVKLVDFGGDKNFGGGDDSEGEITISGSTLNLNEWNTVQVPMSQFAAQNLSSRASLQQLIFSNLNSYKIKNVYFSNVLSLLGADYGNVKVDTWQTAWSGGVLTEITENNIPVKSYQGGFVGVEFVGLNSLNANNLTSFNIDVYPISGDRFCIKLVDFGANNTYQGAPNDDREGEVCKSGLAINSWNTISISMSEYVSAGLSTRANLSQMIFSGISSYKVRNIFFNK